ncbi:MAG: type II toxin-antitoxin system death-on-curing family toxin [Hyphomicrobiales bacterium]|nr:type II toxin-antitoxin system death-on-curing family toxin [Hyphomicrobiales bacterium]
MKEPLWIDERDALILHDRFLALDGGAAGLRDNGLLKSALARRGQHFAYVSGSEIVRLAALYTASIIRDHPFVDGNKRTGFVIGIRFMELNGYGFTASEEDAANAALALAAHDIEESEYAEFLRAHVKSFRRSR